MIDFKLCRSQLFWAAILNVTVAILKVTVAMFGRIETNAISDLFNFKLDGQ